MEGRREIMDFNTWKKCTVAVGIGVGLLMTGVTGCGADETPVEVPELVEPVGVDVDTAVVEKMDLSSINSYQGEVVPDMKSVYFMNSGQVGSVKVEIGDKVKKGQLLATLSGSETDVKELQQELSDQLDENTELNETSKRKITQEQIEYKQLKTQMKKAKSAEEKSNLKKQMIAKQEDIKTRKLQLNMQKQFQSVYIRELKEDIQTAKQQTKLNKLYAPVNGEIITKNLAPGDFVTGGVAVITIADMDQTKIRTEYIGSSVLEKANSYTAIINGRQYEVTAEEQEVSQFDIEMGNFPSSTYFTYQKDEHVSVGDSVSLDFYNHATEDALVIPSNALYKGRGEQYVYRMDGDVKKKVIVTTGTATDAYTQILTGLEEGDVVYVQD